MVLIGSHMMIRLIFVFLGLTLGEKSLAQPISSSAQEQVSMEKLTLDDAGQRFEAMLVRAVAPSRIVLFAVGSGGNPERHLPLLTSLAEQGATVVAPYFERLSTARPAGAELELRARRLRIALDSLANGPLPVMGVGHSIGSTLLIALAGGQLWLGPGQLVPVPTDARFDRLVLMTPPTGFFQAPGALDDVTTPIQVWAGAHDQITPPMQIEFLRQALGERVYVDVRVDEKAGHFTFMNTLPPQTNDPHPNREAFLAKLAVEIQDFLAARTHARNL